MPKRRVAEPTAEYVGRKKATNLTLTAKAIARGERYAQAKNLSLSMLVNGLLEALPERLEECREGPDPGWTASVHELYGAARGAAETPEEAIALYRDYLYQKHSRGE